MKNKKILFIHHGQEIGGAPRSLKNTIIGLEKEGFENLKILCAFPDMKPFFQEGTKVRTGDIYSPHLLIGRLLIGLAHWSNIRTLAGAFIELYKIPIIISKQMKIIKKENPDIIHLNSSILFLVAFSAKLLRIPLVWHVREVIIGSRWNIRKKLAGWLIRKLADEVICISEVEAAALGFNRYKNVNVVYNFIDFNKFHADDDTVQKVREVYALDMKKVVISLGGVSFRKGTVEIIQTAQKIPEVMFLIAGTFPQKNLYSTLKRKRIETVHLFEDVLKMIRLKTIYSWYYEARVEFLFFKLQLSNLLFVGKVDDVTPLIALSDCLIFAGCTPHFPRPIYEAWAMKKAVVAFDIKGVRENITHMQNGAVVRTNDSTGLVENLIFLLNDPKKIETIGNAGYEKALQNFDMQKNVRKIIDIYNKVE